MIESVCAHKLMIIFIFPRMLCTWPTVGPATALPAGPAQTPLVLYTHKIGQGTLLISGYSRPLCISQDTLN